MFWFTSTSTTTTTTTTTTAPAFTALPPLPLSIFCDLTINLESFIERYDSLELEIKNKILSFR